MSKSKIYLSRSEVNYLLGRVGFKGLYKLLKSSNLVCNQETQNYIQNLFGLKPMIYEPYDNAAIKVLKEFRWSKD